MTLPIQLAGHALRYPEAVVRRVVDGDTVDVTLIVRTEPFRGHRHTVEEDRRLRIAHIDAPDKQPAKAAATDLARAHFPPGLPVIVDLYEPEKYGRDLAAVRLAAPLDTFSWAEFMLRNNAATVPYEGGPRG